jgi:hypothetical protein
LSDTIEKIDKAIRRVKTLDSRVEHHERKLRLFQPFIDLEAKGVPITLGKKPLVQAIRSVRDAMDGHIVEELAAEVEDAEQRAAATTVRKKKEGALRDALERVLYFKQKMLVPARIAELEKRVGDAIVALGLAERERDASPPLNVEAAAPAAPTASPATDAGHSGVSSEAFAMLQPGMPVRVAWSDGNLYPATIVQAALGEYLCRFQDGSQKWIGAAYISRG